MLLLLLQPISSQAPHLLARKAPNLAGFIVTRGDNPLAVLREADAPDSPRVSLDADGLPLCRGQPQAYCAVG